MTSMSVLSRLRSLLSMVLVIFLPQLVGAQPTENVLHLNLEQCLQMASENSIRLKQRHWVERENKLRWRQTQTNLLPNINMTTNWNNYYGRSINPTTNTYIQRENRSLQMNMRGSVELFNAFRRYLQIRQAKMNWQDSQYEKESERIVVFLEVVNTYLDILLQEAILDVKEQQLGVSKNRYKTLKKKRKIGELSDYEVAKGRAEALAVAADILRIDNTLHNAQRKLYFLLNIPSEVTIVLASYAEEDLHVMSLPTIDEMYGVSVSIDPSVKSALLKEKSAAVGVQISKRKLYPTLFLRGNMSSSYASANDRPRPITDGAVREITRKIGFLDSNLQETVSERANVPNVIGIDPSYTSLEQLKDNISYNVGLSLNIPIFNQWERRREIQYSAIKLTRAKLQLDAARNALKNNVEIAHNNVLASIKSQKAARIAYEAAAIAYEFATLKYELGDMNLGNYQLEGSIYYESKAKLLRETYTLLFRLRIIDFYTGTWKEKYKL